MKTILVGVATVTTLVATLAWAAVHPSAERSACLTEADVASHLARSRSGISLTCTDEIRAQNLRELVSR